QREGNRRVPTTTTAERIPDFSLRDSLSAPTESAYHLETYLAVPWLLTLTLLMVPAVFPAPFPGIPQPRSWGGWATGLGWWGLGLALGTAVCLVFLRLAPFLEFAVDRYFQWFIFPAAHVFRRLFARPGAPRATWENVPEEAEANRDLVRVSRTFY